LNLWQVFWLVPVDDAFPILFLTEKVAFVVQQHNCKKQLGLTAAGTAPDFNGVPFLIPFTKNELLNLNSVAKIYSFLQCCLLLLTDFRFC
jgi:hypothetical protein